MSIENHPNIHAVLFTANLTEAFYKSLRGKFSNKKLTEQQWEIIQRKMVNFIADISETLDDFAEDDNQKSKFAGLINTTSKAGSPLFRYMRPTSKR